MTAFGFTQGYLDPVYGNVRISKLLAIAIVMTALTFIIVRRVTIKSADYYRDPIIK